MNIKKGISTEFPQCNTNKGLPERPGRPHWPDLTGNFRNIALWDTYPIHMYFIWDTDKYHLTASHFAIF